MIKIVIVRMHLTTREWNDNWIAIITITTYNAYYARQGRYVSLLIFTGIHRHTKRWGGKRCLRSNLRNFCYV